MIEKDRSDTLMKLYQEFSASFIPIATFQVFDDFSVSANYSGQKLHIVYLNKKGKFTL